MISALLKYKLPIAWLVLGAVFAQYNIAVFPAVLEVNMFSVVSEGMVLLIVVFGLFVIQNVNHQKRIFPYLMSGFSLLTLSLLSDFLDEFVDQTPLMTTIFEDGLQVVGFVLIVVGLVRWSSHNDTSQEQIYRYATSDDLTGLCNRRQFATILASEVERAKRYKTPMSLISFDLDHFKGVNEKYGHGVGDDVLKDVTRLVRELIRGADTFARVGGDEFQILAPSTDLGDALGFADKLRSAIEDHRFSHAGFITASFGIAELDPEETVESLMKRTDKALFGSKEGGRNRLVAAP